MNLQNVTCLDLSHDRYFDWVLLIMCPRLLCFFCFVSLLCISKSRHWVSAHNTKLVQPKQLNWLWYKSHYLHLLFFCCDMLKCLDVLSHERPEKLHLRPDFVTVVQLVVRNAIHPHLPFCWQSISVQSEDCNDSSVVDSYGFVPDGVAGQSHNRQSGDYSSLNFILNV